MPNITSVITDLASSAIVSKLSNQNKPKDNSNHNSGGLGSGINLSSALTHITSAISSSSLGKSKTTKENQFTTPEPNQPMSGYPPPNSYPGGGSAYPQANPVPNQSGYGNPYPGYPPQQPAYPGYEGNNQQGIGFNLGNEGEGYPPQQPCYAGGGYSSSQSSYPGGGYQPNVGGLSSYPAGGGYGSNSYPSGGPTYPSSHIQYPPSQQPSYGRPPSSGQVYPTQAVDSVQQFYGGPPLVSDSRGGQLPYSSPPANQSAYIAGGQPSYSSATTGQLPYSSAPPSGGYSGSQFTNMFAQSNPTIKPNPNFNASHTAEMLRNAMKGFGCNKDKVIQALCTISNWQRQEVIKAFKQQYGKDLISDLKSELHGDFEGLVLALMEPPARYDAQQLHKAMAGLGTRESVLIEIMTTRSNAQIQELKYTYQQMYKSELEKDLVGETSGHFKRLLVSLCCGGRDESARVDPLRANQDARALYRAGEQRLGTDESQFNAILAAQNFAQLRLVFQEYQTVSGHSIEQAIHSEFSSDIRDGLLAIVKSIRSRPGFFAELIHKSMVGMGTRDNDLIRLIVTRSEIDLADIRNVYPSLFNTSLDKAIAGDCSGAYKEGLIALVKGN